jgi:multimeric flavodoxin WrbA
MKVTGVIASPRGKKGNTYPLLIAALTGAEDEGAETEIINIAKSEINYCTGCLKCFKSGKCIYDDDFEKVFSKLMKSDGIIFASPNYINSVTGQMKTFFDRMADAIHCQMFEGKYGFSISTAGGSGAGEVSEYMNQTLRVLGADTTGHIGMDIAEAVEGFKPWEERAYEEGQKLASAIKNNEKYPEQEEFHKYMQERMEYLILANKKEWKHEYRHLKKKKGE